MQRRRRLAGIRMHGRHRRAASWDANSSDAQLKSPALITMHSTMVVGQGQGAQHNDAAAAADQDHWPSVFQQPYKQLFPLIADRNLGNFGSSGLSNVCFMNSVLQILFHTQPIASHYYQMVTTYAYNQDECGGEGCDALARQGVQALLPAPPGQQQMNQAQAIEQVPQQARQGFQQAVQQRLSQLFFTNSNNQQNNRVKRFYADISDPVELSFAGLLSQQMF